MRSAALALALATTALAACGETTTAPVEAEAIATVAAETGASETPAATESTAPEVSASATPSAGATPTASSSPAERKSAGLSGAAAKSAAHDRHEKYEALGKANKAVFDELRKPEPDLAVVRKNAAAIRDYAVQMVNWFPAGTGPQDGVKTDSKANVWTDWAGFKRAHNRMLTQARAFVTTAEGGDIDAIKSGSRTLGAACKNCHDDYRVEDD